MSGVLDRRGLRTPFARDVALAVVLAVLGVALLVPLTGAFAGRLGVHLSPAQRGLVLVLSAAQALAVALRRVRTGLCLLLVTGLQVVLTVTLSSQATVQGLPLLIAFYTAGSHLPVRRLLRWAGAAVLLELVGTPLLDVAAGPQLLATLGASPTAGQTSVGGWLLAGVTVVVVHGAAAGAGIVVATRRENLALLRARAEAAERSRADDARRAVEAERLRMARELHDVAAHHLTGLLVQASAAERLVARDRPGALDALREVRDQGKQALDNLRAVVGVLRNDGTPRRGPGELDPTPGLAVLPDLVESARALGDRVRLETTGTPYALTPLADVAAYRVTQEALSNARQHAVGQPVGVRLAYGPDATVVTVRNDLGGPVTPGPRDGFGLAGMRERAALVGGTLEAGPQEGPAWVVELRVPAPRRVAS